MQAQDAEMPMLDASLRIDYQVSTSGRGLHQGGAFFCLDNEASCSRILSFTLCGCGQVVKIQRLAVAKVSIKRRKLRSQ
jgi:hypothetical protein